jgi:hypothetical protein
VQTLNLEKVLLHFLKELLQPGVITVDITTLQNDIALLNKVLDSIQSLFPGSNPNLIIQFLKQVDTNPILQNIILLVVNGSGLGNAEKTS